MQVVLTPVFDAAGRAVGSQGVFWDVTPRLAAERQLTARRRRPGAGQHAPAARSNADLEQFAYVASHDLQEPLRMVASYTQLLRRRYQGQPRRRRRRVHRLRRGRRDAHAAPDRRPAQVLARGHRGGPLRETDARRAFTQAVANLQAAVRESGAEVYARDLPAVHADATQLAQLFQNLIHNAIKFHIPSRRGAASTARSRRGCA